jgi:hypothetical protein
MPLGVRIQKKKRYPETRMSTNCFLQELDWSRRHVYMTGRSRRWNPGDDVLIEGLYAAWDGKCC